MATAHQLVTAEELLRCRMTAIVMSWSGESCGKWPQRDIYMAESPSTSRPPWTAMSEIMTWVSCVPPKPVSN